MAKPICLTLLAHFVRSATARIRWTAGRIRPMRVAMIAMTTSSSTRVKPLRRTIGVGSWRRNPVGAMRRFESNYRPHAGAVAGAWPDGVIGLDEDGAVGEHGATIGGRGPYIQ